MKLAFNLLAIVSCQVHKRRGGERSIIKGIVASRSSYDNFKYEVIPND